MSLVNFNSNSISQLRSILGSFGNDELSLAIRSGAPYIESQYFQVSDIVEIEVEGADNQKEYKAFQVRPDGTPVESGIIFDSDGVNTSKVDDPVYYKNLRVNDLIFSGTVELGFAYKVEAVWDIDKIEDPVYYIIPKGGGGASIFRLRSKQSNTIGYIDLTETGFDLIDNGDNILEEDVPVIQRKFNQCEFYENEILYATLDSDGVYDLSPFMSGVGVGNA